MHKNSRTRHSFLYVNLKLIHTFPQKYMYTYTRQAFYSLDTHSNKSMQRSHHIQKYHIFTKYFLNATSTQGDIPFIHLYSVFLKPSYLHSYIHELAKKENSLTLFFFHAYSFIQYKFKIYIIYIYLYRFINIFIHIFIIWHTNTTIMVTGKNF